MSDPYEKLRDLLTDSLYCRSDMAVDQNVRRVATALAESVREIVKVGKALERSVGELETVDDLPALIDQLNGVAGILAGVAENLTSPDAPYRVQTTGGDY